VHRAVTNTFKGAVNLKPLLAGQQLEFKVQHFAGLATLSIDLNN
jgi:hypothetical protein